MGAAYYESLIESCPAEAALNMRVSIKDTSEHIMYVYMCKCVYIYIYICISIFIAMSFSGLRSLVAFSVASWVCTCELSKRRLGFYQLMPIRHRELSENTSGQGCRMHVWLWLGNVAGNSSPTSEANEQSQSQGIVCLSMQIRSTELHASRCLARWLP